MIAGNAGSKVRLSFLDLDMESAPNCRFDYVEVSVCWFSFSFDIL